MTQNLSPKLGVIFTAATALLLCARLKPARAADVPGAICSANGYYTKRYCTPYAGGRVRNHSSNGVAVRTCEGGYEGFTCHKTYVVASQYDRYSGCKNGCDDIHGTGSLPAGVTYLSTEDDPAQSTCTTPPPEPLPNPGIPV